VPRKIRELIADLERAGFTNIGGKGSYRNFVHLKRAGRLTLSGSIGSDAQAYQEKAVREAIEEVRS